MQLIPAVDLLGEDATRLEQGDFDRELFRRPATDFVRLVAATKPAMIHLVDLQGARDGVLRPDVLKACIEAAGGIPMQVSGGIRSRESAEEVLALGAARILVGTAAFRDKEFLRDLVATHGDRIAVTIDVADGNVRVAGWREGVDLDVATAMAYCIDAGVSRVIGTAIDRDGTMAGPDLDLYRQLCDSPLKVLAAGGVRDDDDVRALEVLGCEGAIMGRAYLSRLAS